MLNEIRKSPAKTLEETLPQLRAATAASTTAEQIAAVLAELYVAVFKIVDGVFNGTQVDQDIKSIFNSPLGYKLAESNASTFIRKLHPRNEYKGDDVAYEDFVAPQIGTLSRSVSLTDESIGVLARAEKIDEKDLKICGQVNSFTAKLLRAIWLNSVTDLLDSRRKILNEEAEYLKQDAKRALEFFNVLNFLTVTIQDTKKALNDFCIAEPDVAHMRSQLLYQVVFTFISKFQIKQQQLTDLIRAEKLQNGSAMLNLYEGCETIFCEIVFKLFLMRDNLQLIYEESSSKNLFLKDFHNCLMQSELFASMFLERQDELKNAKLPINLAEGTFSIIDSHTSSIADEDESERNGFESDSESEDEVEKELEKSIAEDKSESEAKESEENKVEGVNEAKEKEAEENKSENRNEVEEKGLEKNTSGVNEVEVKESEKNRSEEKRDLVGVLADPKSVAVQSDGIAAALEKNYPELLRIATEKGAISFLIAKDKETRNQRRKLINRRRDLNMIDDILNRYPHSLAVADAIREKGYTRYITDPAVKKHIRALGSATKKSRTDALEYYLLPKSNNEGEIPNAENILPNINFILSEKPNLLDKLTLLKILKMHSFITDKNTLGGLNQQFCRPNAGTRFKNSILRRDSLYTRFKKALKHTKYLTDNELSYFGSLFAVAYEAGLEDELQALVIRSLDAKKLSDSAQIKLKALMYVHLPTAKLSTNEAQAFTSLTTSRTKSSSITPQISERVPPAEKNKKVTKRDIAVAKGVQRQKEEVEFLESMATACGVSSTDDLPSAEGVLSVGFVNRDQERYLQLGDSLLPKELIESMFKGNADYRNVLKEILSNDGYFVQVLKIASKQVIVAALIEMGYLSVKDNIDVADVARERLLELLQTDSVSQDLVEKNAKVSATLKLRIKADSELRVLTEDSKLKPVVLLQANFKQDLYSSASSELIILVLSRIDQIKQVGFNQSLFNAICEDKDIYNKLFDASLPAYQRELAMNHSFVQWVLKTIEGDAKENWRGLKFFDNTFDNPNLISEELIAILDRTWQLCGDQRLLQFYENNPALFLGQKSEALSIQSSDDEGCDPLLKSSPRSMFYKDNGAPDNDKEKAKMQKLMALTDKIAANLGKTPSDRVRASSLDDTQPQLEREEEIPTFNM